MRQGYCYPCLVSTGGFRSGRKVLRNSVRNSPGRSTRRKILSRLLLSWSLIFLALMFPWSFLTKEMPWCLSALSCLSRLSIFFSGVQRGQDTLVFWGGGGGPSVFTPKHQGMEDQGLLLVPTSELKISSEIVSFFQVSGPSGKVP